MTGRVSEGNRHLFQHSRTPNKRRYRSVTVSVRTHTLTVLSEGEAYKVKKEVKLNVLLRAFPSLYH